MSSWFFVIGLWLAGRLLMGEVNEFGAILACLGSGILGMWITTKTEGNDGP